MLTEIEERYKQIKAIIEHIKFLESDNAKNSFHLKEYKIDLNYKNNFKNILDNKFNKIKFDSKLNNILKSSVFVMFYNIIEYTIMNIIERIHEEMKNEEYSQIKEKIRYVINNYYRKWIQKLSKEELDENIKNLIWNENIKKEFSNFCLEIKKHNENYNHIWNNVKKKQINIFLEEYVLEKPKQDKNTSEEYIDYITNKRNEISHWEYSFYTLSKDINIIEIESKVEITYKYLIELIKNVEQYLEDKAFLDI